MDWHIYLIWLVVASVITFLVYGIDKAQAKMGAWRVPQVALHVLSLVGGFPGGWAGRSIFRHKTQKGFFVFVLTISTLIYLSLAYWLFFK